MISLSIALLLPFCELHVFVLFVPLRRGQSVSMAMYILLSFSSSISCIGVPYYRIIMLHEIKVLEINGT